MAVAADRRSSPGPLKVEKAYRQLRRMIITHELPPGTPIDERDLIQRLGTGRTPLREAMLRLAHERLIVRSPRRGAWVSQLSLEDMQQLSEARTMIEPAVAGRAARRMTPDVAERLQALLDSVESAVTTHDFATIAIADLDFHILLGKQCDNAYLSNFSLEINTSLLRYWQLSFRLEDSGQLWYDLHVDLLRKIADRDPDGAIYEAARQIDIYRDRMRTLIF